MQTCMPGLYLVPIWFHEPEMTGGPKRQQQGQEKNIPAATLVMAAATVTAAIAHSLSPGAGEGGGGGGVVAPVVRGVGQAGSKVCHI